ncbi:MAG: MazG family protein [Planctomycetaceae bacterium]|nr:MazG family protein [Planctomycetaceae bacterium]
MQELLAIMRRLRAPDGCPWDREQTHSSLRPYLLEEAAEAVEAIESGDSEWMVDELGDVLLQVAFHAVIGEASGRFRYEDIESSIVNKLIRRHPHVFGTTQVSNADEVVINWQAIKAQEPTRKKTIPGNLPTIMRATALAKQRSATGSSPPSMSELQQDAERLQPTPRHLAQFLFSVIAYAQSQKVDLEMALRDFLAEQFSAATVAAEIDSNDQTATRPRHQ